MIQELDILEFDYIYKIMTESFPDDEYRPYNQQKALLNDPYYHIYTYRNHMNEIIAFMAIWHFEQFDYIEHFAVREDYRNKGIGSQFLSEMTDMLSGNVILEVELPDNDLAKRRICFYKKQKFFYNEYNYMQPPMSKGKNKVPLKIMSLNNKITEIQFIEIKNTLYKHVYKYIEKEDK